jgi:sterol desaturase/sphingolipid hydroxylase (fatty acid hydroxylase superfamily)
MLDLITQQAGKISQALHILVSPSSIFGLPQLSVAAVIAIGFLLVRQRRRRGRVRIAALARALRQSRRILVCPSTRADLFCYLLNTFAISGLIGWGLVSGNLFAGAVTRLLHMTGFAPAPSQAPGWLLRGGLTICVFTAYEFGYYLDHYLKHKIPFLWEFHKTHHSAEVLTPLTVFRVHPVDTLIFVNIITGCMAASYSVFAYATGQKVSLYTLDGANVISVAGFFILSQLQHSQFWIPFRGWAGRLLLSPAHHQIHHSNDSRHFDRNLGSFLAVFDWLFGTLCIPEARAPGLRFGVEQAGNGPHRLSTLLISPFVNALGTLRGVFAQFGKPRRLKAR